MWKKLWCVKKPREITDEEVQKQPRWNIPVLLVWSDAAVLVVFYWEQVEGKKLSSVENRTLSREHDQKRHKDRAHESFYPLCELVYK